MEEDTNISLLLSMGFGDVVSIRKALKKAKNDVNEAVGILTNDEVSPVSNSVSHTVSDVDMTDTRSEESETDAFFPVSRLRELERSVLASSEWTIATRREDALGQCLVAAKQCVLDDKYRENSNFASFAKRVLPEAMDKLLNSGCVRSWSTELQEGIFDLCELFVEFLTVRLKQRDDVPLELLKTLATLFDPQCEFHKTNKNRGSRGQWRTSSSASSRVVSSSTPFWSRSSTNVWLRDLINAFGNADGFYSLHRAIVDSKTTLIELHHLLHPISNCINLLTNEAINSILSACVQHTIEQLLKLEGDSLRGKQAMALSNLHPVLTALATKMDLNYENVRFEVTLRMLNVPHYDAKMNALRDINALIDSVKLTNDQSKTRELIELISEKEVISIALNGSVDQLQYTERLGSIVHFLANDLREKDFVNLWKQIEKHSNAHVTANIFAIIKSVAARLGQKHIELFDRLFRDTFTRVDDIMREGLLELLGQIGADFKVHKSTVVILKILWDMSCDSSLCLSLCEGALREQLNILDHLVVNRAKTKRQYIGACMELIQQGHQLLHQIKYLEAVLRSWYRDVSSSSYYSKSRNSYLAELNEDLSVIPALSNSLKIYVESKAASFALAEDEKHSREDVLKAHLTIIDFLLKEGELYLELDQALKLFQALVESSKSTEVDHKVFFNWMRGCIADMREEHQELFFNKKLLNIKVDLLGKAGFECLKTFLVALNVHKENIKKNNENDNNFLIVNNAEGLVGSSHLWKVLTDVEDSAVAALATESLLDIYFRNVALRIQRESGSDLHSAFITRCFDLAKNAYAQLHQGHQHPSSKKTQSHKTAKKNDLQFLSRRLERVFQLLIRYVFAVEQIGYHGSRSALPHRNTYRGAKVTVKVFHEGKSIEIMSHENETVGRMKDIIASALRKCESDFNCMRFNDNELTFKQNNRLLRDFCDIKKVLTVTIRPRVPSVSTLQLSSSSLTSSDSRFFSPDEEDEARLPGIMLASLPDFFTFLRTVLEDSDLRCETIKKTVYELLQLLPTDPVVSGAIHSLSASCFRSSEKASASPSASPRVILNSPFVFNVDNDLTKLLDPKLVHSSILMLYHLEALSAALRPVVGRDQDENTTMAVTQVFKSLEGVRLLLNILSCTDWIFEDSTSDTESAASTEFGALVLHCVITLLSFVLSGQDEEAYLELNDKEDYSTENDNGLTLSTDYVFRLSSRPSPAKRGNFDIGVNNMSNSRALFKLNKDDFDNLISGLVNIAWAAAAGNLNLVKNDESSNLQESERLGSKLHYGICSPAAAVSSLNSGLASLCLKLLVYSLTQRKRSVNVFFDLPRIEDFILDTVLNCSCDQVRFDTCEELCKLATVRNPSRALSLGDTTAASLQSPLSCKHRLALMILEKQVPLWIYRPLNPLMAQSEAYFNLRASLLQDLSTTEQRQLLKHHSVWSMIEEELSFLNASKPLGNSETALLSGHLRLLRALITCEGIDKEKIGRTLMGDFLRFFLFPASNDEESKSEGEKTPMSGGSSSLMHPKCDTVASRVSAYNLLVEFCRNCSINLSDLSTRLVRMHHLFNPDLSKNFDYVANVEQRADSGYVGLKNAGSTCYMNAVLQQVWATPTMCQQILATKANNMSQNDKDNSLLYQLQLLFAHLSMLRVRYFEPRQFWRSFKLFDQPVNVREQQDAFEFFTQLIDQLDEQLKGNQQGTIFGPRFIGLFSDEKMCNTGCSHTYEREQEFVALNLPVKSNNLLAALEQFVQGDLLENDNAYYCEQCDVKRSAIKHMRIKRLPKTLVIQLKRFHYDWETQRAMKFDDFFSFPTTLDMKPYMTRDKESKKSRKNENTTYELVGIVVHSGQANAGHYYSFIKERRLEEYEQNFGKWFKFNDTSVEQFDMNESSLREECFGGDFENNSSSGSRVSFNVKRVRSWNAYLLLYEACETKPVVASKVTPMSATPNTKTTLTTRRVSRRSRPKSVSSSSVPAHDRLSQLSDLMLRSEKEGVFTRPSIPVEIERSIREENLSFLENRDVYSVEYFDFVVNLVKANKTNMISGNRDDSDRSSLVVSSLKLATQFLLNTYLHLRDCSKDRVVELQRFMAALIDANETGCIWLTKFLAANHAGYFRPLLLECNVEERRCSVVDLMLAVYKATSKHKHKHKEESKNNDDLKIITTQIVALVERDAADNYRNAKQLFALISQIANLNKFTCGLLLDTDAFSVLGRFLVGSEPNLASFSVPKRKWTAIQSRHFGQELHAAMAHLILTCHLQESDQDRTEKLPMPSSSLKTLTDANFMKAYLREAVLFLRETHEAVDALVTTSLVELARFSDKFSHALIEEVLFHFSKFRPGELKQLSNLLINLICLEDSEQTMRLAHIVHGEPKWSAAALLPIVKHAASALEDNEGQMRAYQSVKILVASSNRSSRANKFLLTQPEKWEVAVNWLRSRLEDDESDSLSEEDNAWIMEKTDMKDGRRHLDAGPVASSSQSTSNDGQSRVFRRTTSAQVTLEEAKAILYQVPKDEREDEDQDTVMTEVDQM